jgi:hypothetical protein
MTILLPLCPQRRDTANGNDKNSKRPLNFFVAFPKGAQRARRAELQHGAIMI